MQKDLELITEEKGLPRYSAFRSAVDLGKRLYKEISKLEVENANLYYFIPSPYIIDDKIEPSRFKLFIDLSSIVLSTSVMYEKSDGRLNHFRYIDTEKLKSLYPSGSILAAKESSFENHLEESINQLAVKCAEMIEDSFYEFTFYDRRKSNPLMEREMEKVAVKISEDSKLAIEIADIIDGYNLHWLSGEMKGVMKNLSDTDRLLADLRRGDEHRSLDNLLKFHSHLFGLDYNGNPFAFTNLFGQEISASMLIAREIFHLKDTGANFNLEKKDRLAVGYKGYIFAQEWDKDVRAAYKRDRISLIGESLIEDSLIEVHMRSSKSPFLGLEERLHALGVPSREAVAIAGYLSFNFMERLHSKRGRSLDNGEVLKALQKEDEDYAGALYSFMTSAIRKKPHPFIYKFYDGDVSQADAIDAIVYAVERKEGKTEIKSESWSKFGPDLGFAKAVRMFGIPENDIYVGVNSGVCFLFGEDLDGFIKRPSFSIIEARDVNRELKGTDPIAYNLLKKQVDFHEVIHAMQVDTRLIWRSFALQVAHFCLDQAIKQAEVGRLDSIYPFQKLRRMTSKKHTWKEEMVQDLDLYMSTALGTGPIADEMRKGGVYNVAYRYGFSLLEDGSISMRALRSDAPLERSGTARIASKVRKAIEKGDIEDMISLEREVLDRIVEIEGLVETMAESFSIYASKLYLENYPDRRYGDKKKEMCYQNLLRRAQFRGKQASTFHSIADNLPKEVWQPLLEDRGMRYSQFIKKEEIGQASDRLRKLGYDTIFPEEAYDDMKELTRRVKESGEPLELFLTPMNAAYAVIGERYEKNTGKVLSLIDRYGVKKAFGIMEDAESFSHLDKLLKNPLKRAQ